jgi:hypothetical protein
VIGGNGRLRGKTAAASPAWQFLFPGDVDENFTISLVFLAIASLCRRRQFAFPAHWPDVLFAQRTADGAAYRT